MDTNESITKKAYDQTHKMRKTDLYFRVVEIMSHQREDLLQRIRKKESLHGDDVQALWNVVVPLTDESFSDGDFEELLGLLQADQRRAGMTISTTALTLPQP